MRKMIFTFMLAIASSVWMMNEALCLAPFPEAMYQPFATVSGTFVSVPIPCEPSDEYPCPTCLTLALRTSNRLYYLTADNADIQKQLEAIEYRLSEVADITGTISGTPYTESNFEYIRVQAVDTTPVHLHLSSLCDEWNIMMTSIASGPPEKIHTIKTTLGADTIIQMQNYVKLIEDGTYQGALREGNNADIYYIPAGSTHEYLLYNFHANVGDRLSNLWYGGLAKWCPNGYNALVRSISKGTPRVFTIEVEYVYSDREGDYIEPYTVYWTEGVGLSGGPAGKPCPGPECLCSCGQVVLCAYKNGELVYVSEKGKQYGCEYNNNEQAGDTILLYAQDDPGSSTVDPVDPNQVVATLKGNELTIHENIGVDITYSLNHTAPAQAPSRNKAPQSDTFRDEVTIQITESGEYLLQLTNPSWGYTIYGRFYYGPQGIDEVPSSPQDEDRSRLLLRNGQIYIFRDDRTYTLTGQEVK